MAFVFGPAALGLTFEDRDALVVNLLAINVAALVVPLDQRHQADALAILSTASALAYTI